jgi:hypothetical protein
LAVFLVSGFLHELVITLPAGGAYGLPTVYFAVQGLGALLQKSGRARTLKLDCGWRGRAFTIVAALGPLPLLFPPVFVRNVILPMLQTIGAIGGTI